MFAWLRKDDRGFTLVELMMVIVILGILAGVSIPMLGNMRDSAWKSKLASTCDTLGMVAATNATETGDAPANAAAIKVLASLPANVDVVDALPTPRITGTGYIVYEKKNPMEFTAYRPGDSTGELYTYAY